LIGYAVNDKYSFYHLCTLCTQQSTQSMPAITCARRARDRLSASKLNRKDKTMNTKHTNSTPVLRKIARIEDKATGKFVEEIEFSDSPTGVRRRQLLPSIVSDPGKFESHLLDFGAILPDDSEARKALLADVAKSKAPNHYVYEAQGGWLEPGKVFVLPDGAISAETTNVIGVSPSYATSDPCGRRTSSGDLTKWRDTVGQIYRLSSLAMFATSKRRSLRPEMPLSSTLYPLTAIGIISRQLRERPLKETDALPFFKLIGQIGCRCESTFNPAVNNGVGNFSKLKENAHPLAPDDFVIW
jgi:hypothetical protein